jgi:hypothetical protein
MMILVVIGGNSVGDLKMEEETGEQADTLSKEAGGEQGRVIPACVRFRNHAKLDLGGKKLDHTAIRSA